MDNRDLLHSDSDHQAAEIARGVAADGERARLRSVLARISDKQEAATRQYRKQPIGDRRTFIEGRAFGLREAADILKEYIENL